MLVQGFEVDGEVEVVGDERGGVIDGGFLTGGVNAAVVEVGCVLFEREDAAVERAGPFFG